MSGNSGSGSLKLRDGLRKDVEREIALNEEHAAAVGRDGGTPRESMLAMLVLVAVNVLAVLLISRYVLAWVAASLVVMLALFVLTFLPTSRGGVIEGLSIPFRKLSNLRGANKSVVMALFINSALMGVLPMMPGIVSILGMNILLAVLTFDAMGQYDPFLAGWVVAQSALIIGFFVWLLLYRPYSSGFLRSLGEIVRKLTLEGGDSADKRQSLLSLTLFTMFSTAVLLGAFILPGATLGRIYSPSSGPLIDSIVPLIFALATQMFAVRAWQVEESKRWARRFLENKRRMLLGLQQRIDNSADIEGMRSELLVTRVMRLQAHDLFGHLPIYSLVPDLAVLLSHDHIEELSRLSPTEALRITDF